MAGLGSYCHRELQAGNRDVMAGLLAQEANLLHARALARDNGWWSAVVNAMQGLETLYLHTGRQDEWKRLVRETVPEFVDPETEEPLPGREEFRDVMNGYVTEKSGAQATRPHLIPDPHQPGVGQGVAEPGTGEMAGAVVEPGPEEAGGGDHQGDREGQDSEAPQEMADHQDVVGGEGQGRHHRRRGEGEPAVQASEDEPAPVVLLQEGVDDRVERGEEEELRARVDPEGGDLLRHGGRGALEGRACGEDRTPGEEEDGDDGEAGDQAEEEPPPHPSPAARERGPDALPEDPDGREGELNHLGDDIGVHGPARSRELDEVQPGGQRREQASKGQGAQVRAGGVVVGWHGAGSYPAPLCRAVRPGLAVVETY